MDGKIVGYRMDGLFLQSGNFIGQLDPWPIWCLNMLPEISPENPGI